MPATIVDSLVYYALSDSKSGFDLHAHVLWCEVESSGGRCSMPPLRGWPLGKEVYRYDATLYAMMCYDGCSKRWLLMRLSDKKFYRFRSI